MLSVAFGTQTGHASPQPPQSSPGRLSSPAKQREPRTICAGTSAIGSPPRPGNASSGSSAKPSTTCMLLTSVVSAYTSARATRLKADSLYTLLNAEGTTLQKKMIGPVHTAMPPPKCPCGAAWGWPRARSASFSCGAATRTLGTMATAAPRKMMAAPATCGTLKRMPRNQADMSSVIGMTV